MARNPKPVEQLQGHRSKDELEKLFMAQKQFNTDSRERLIAPFYFDELGVQIFNETVETYEHLNDQDLDALVIYSQAYSQWIKRTQRMLSGDYEDESKLQILIDKSENAMIKFGTKLCLYQVDRVKLANEKANEIAQQNDPLANIFGGNDDGNEQDFIIP